MKAWFEKLERLFAAVTFAEAGEFATARQLAEDRQPTSSPSRLPAGQPGRAAAN